MQIVMRLDIPGNANNECTLNDKVGEIGDAGIVRILCDLKQTS